MHLDGATYEDTGVYTCQMPPLSDIETERRAKARSFFVKVTGKPMVTNITLSSDAVLGQPASLRATFCADPPPTQLLWVLGQFAARPGHHSALAHAANTTDGAHNSCFEATLFVPALRPEMTGEVTVLVVNALGADQLTRPLAVSRPSHVTFGGAPLNNRTARSP
ncbi:uncharacterized protein LOC119093365 [Pollicipes pollicipes]|uniref:uncharacterized protein LOC119093365 n=1 Tax=Pollicipes pollicipes TaxID=41117 RepID=UPI0018855E64|nr:uncharacterized protein LOC119093365 [Pollicipes pollicipes]